VVSKTLHARRRPTADPSLRSGWHSKRWDRFRAKATADPSLRLPHLAGAKRGPKLLRSGWQSV